MAKRKRKVRLQTAMTHPGGVVTHLVHHALTNDGHGGIALAACGALLEVTRLHGGLNPGPYFTACRDAAEAIRHQDHALAFAVCGRVQYVVAAQREAQEKLKQKRGKRK